MPKSEEIRVGGKSYQGIVDTAKRYDKNKEKPVVANSLVDGQRRKLDKLMARVDKPINIPGQSKEWKPADPKEFVRNVMGSSAGAGSGEFHVYRAIRKRTMQREEFMSKQKQKSDLQAEFDKRVAENKAADDAKTAKKRLKRQRLKANKKKPKVEKDDEADSDGDEETKDDEKTEAGQVKIEEVETQGSTVTDRDSLRDNSESSEPSKEETKSN